MTPILYFFVRSDLESLNPGKAMAQVSHATSLFVKKMEEHGQKLDGAEDHMGSLYVDWKNSTSQGFGTAIVIDIFDEIGLNDILYDAEKNGQFINGIVHDPTYPIRDGNVTHYIPLDTCGFVFADTEMWKPNKKYKLYP